MYSLISTSLVLRIFKIGTIFRFTAEPTVRGWGLESEVDFLWNGGPIPWDVFDSTPKVKIYFVCFVTVMVPV